MNHIEEDVRIWDDELPEPTDGKHLIDPITGKKILRPRNAWILYRNARLDDVGRLPDGSRQPMAEASKVISRWWKEERQEVKARYELEAEREKAEHRRKYPNYRFQPKSKQQKQKEQEAKKEAKKKMQLAAKKARGHGLTPPAFSSVQTSYVAAALANQAASVMAPTLPPSTMSPPLSLASTPIHVASPMPYSEQESGSYSTPSTTSSPAGALGLLPSMTFTGQEAANARVPQRGPSRLPPRSKASRYASSSSSGSRVPSYNILAPPTPPNTSPASSSGVLSPLPWHVTQQQPSPASDGNTSAPQSLLSDEPNSLLDAWINPSALDNSSDSSGSVSIELDFGSKFDTDGLQGYFDANEFAILQSSDGQGVYEMSADGFLGNVPNQIDVSLAGPSNEGLSTEDQQAFSLLLETFDFSSLANGSSSSLEPPLFDLTDSDPASSDGWTGMAGVDTSTPGFFTHDDLSCQPQHQDTECSTQPESDSRRASHSHTIAQPQPHQLFSPQINVVDVPSIQPQPSLPQPGMPYDIPAELAQNPLFQDWFSKIASTQQFAAPSSSPPPQPHSRHNLPPAQQPESTRYGTQLVHNPAETLPSPPVSESHSAPPAHFVPPPGANRTHTRRVAASWKPPTSRAEPPSWSGSASTGHPSTSSWHGVSA